MAASPAAPPPALPPAAPTVPSAPAAPEAPPPTAAAATMAAIKSTEAKAVVYGDIEISPLLTALSTPEGTQRLADARASGTSVYELVWPHFRKQRGDTACGLATVATMLQALFAQSPSAASSSSFSAIATAASAASAVLFQERTMLDGLGTDVPADLKWSAVKEQGLTLELVCTLLERKGNAAVVPAGSQRVEARALHAVSFSEQELRTRLIELLRTPPAAAAASSDGKAAPASASSVASGVPSAALVLCAANLCLKTVGYDATVGHHSPLVAYHANSDSVLLLDVWPSFAHSWIPVALLYKALNTIDPDSQKTRGLLLASWQSAAAAASTPSTAAAAAASKS